MIKKYEQICNEIVKEFCKKQELDFDPEMWVAGEVGGVICLGDYYFNLLDIVRDLKTMQPKGLILDWYNETLDEKDEGIYINYKSYTMGLRYD